MSALSAYVLSLLLWKFPPGKQPEIETREQGAARYEVVAAAIADSASARAGEWPGGARDLARTEASAFGWSMGFRLDVQTGAKRGPAGESCFSDMQFPTLRRFATFPTEHLSNEELAAMVVGLDYDSLRRCLDAGTAALVHVRRVAARRCRNWPTDLATFALYANGNYCSSGRRDWIERKRYQTLLSMRAQAETLFPAWYVPSTDERVAEATP